MNLLKTRVMEYYLYAGAFVLGGFLVYLLTRYRIKILLKNELRSYHKELKKKKKWWPPELYPMLPILKRHKDFYKRESEHRERELEEIGWQLDQERLKMASATQELEELKRENRELKTIINSPAEAKASFKGGNGGERGTALSSPHDTNRNAGKPREEMNVFYFGIPDNLGNFPAGQGDSHYDSRKLYMIVTRPGSDRGELHYVSGELDMKAINNIDYYLVPVCDISDISARNNATRVIQESKGSVILATGKWVCTTRVKVKLV